MWFRAQQARDSHRGWPPQHAGEGQFSGRRIFLANRTGQGNRDHRSNTSRRLTMRARIILADDHRLFTEGLAKLLTPTFEVIRMVTDGRELVTTATELIPDVIISDLSMPLLNGMEALRMLRRSGIRSKFVVVTVHADVSV